MLRRTLAAALGSLLIAAGCSSSGLTEEQKTFCQEYPYWEEFESTAADLGIDFESILEGGDEIYDEVLEETGDDDAASEAAYDWAEKQSGYVEVCQALFEDQ